MSKYNENLWWAARELNPRPLRCERRFSAYPIDLTASGFHKTPLIISIVRKLALSHVRMLRCGVFNPAIAF
jgi:hypothetical protein